MKKTIKPSDSIQFLLKGLENLLENTDLEPEKVKTQITSLKSLSQELEGIGSSLDIKNEELEDLKKKYALNGKSIEEDPQDKLQFEEWREKFFTEFYKKERNALIQKNQVLSRDISKIISQVQSQEEFWKQKVLNLRNELKNSISQNEFTTRKKNDLEQKIISLNSTIETLAKEKQHLLKANHKYKENLEKWKQYETKWLEKHNQSQKSWQKKYLEHELFKEFSQQEIELLKRNLKLHQVEFSSLVKMKSVWEKEKANQEELILQLENEKKTWENKEKDWNTQKEVWKSESWIWKKRANSWKATERKWEMERNAWNIEREKWKTREAELLERVDSKLYKDLLSDFERHKNLSKKQSYQIHELKTNMDIKANEIEHLKARNKELEENILQKEFEFNKLKDIKEAEINRSKKSKSDQHRFINELKSQLSISNTKLQDLKTEVLRLKSKQLIPLQKNEVKLNSYKQMNDKLESELNKYKAQNEQISQALLKQKTFLDKDKEALMEEKALLREEKAFLNSTVGHLELRVKELESERLTLNEKLQVQTEKKEKQLLALLFGLEKEVTNSSAKKQVRSWIQRLQIEGLLEEDS